MEKVEAHRMEEEKKTTEASVRMVNRRGTN